MNTLMLSRSLGWFSLGLGATEAAAPHALARLLGLRGEGWLVRSFGVREIVAGVTVLGKPDASLGPMLRVAGDMLDLAVLAPALSSRNPRHKAADVAFAMVLGVTALDVLCVSALVADERRRSGTAARTRALPPPAPRPTRAVGPKARAPRRKLA